MKKRLSIMMLVAVIATAAVLFVGCGGMSGQKVTAEEFVTAMEAYYEAISEGNIEVKYTMTQKDEDVNMSGELVLKVQDGKKLYMKMTAKGTRKGVSSNETIEIYIDSTDTTSYYITKDAAGKWVGEAGGQSVNTILSSSLAGFDAFMVSEDDFDEIEYKNGRYYAVDDESGEGYVVFNDGKLTGMVVDMKEGDESIKMEVKISYNPTVTIPSYTKD